MAFEFETYWDVVNHDESCNRGKMTAGLDRGNAQRQNTHYHVSLHAMLNEPIFRVVDSLGIFLDIHSSQVSDTGEKVTKKLKAPRRKSLCICLYPPSTIPHPAMPLLFQAWWTSCADSDSPPGSW